jgi:hypothetical protein
VLGLDLSLYHDERFARQRELWAARARSLVGDLFGSFQFDVALAPADDTPYWRDIALGVEELGVPFVVLFKETTHPPGQLRTIAPLIRRYVPVTARQVLVNSAMTAEYMVACGADAANVHVVGQPRFDVYATPRTFDRPAGTARRFLFLTYEFDAYRPNAVRDGRADRVREFLIASGGHLPATLPPPVDQTWLGLRCDTERVLIASAAAEGASVVVKPHRQMDQVDLAFDRSFVESQADAMGVSLRYAPATDELSPLLAEADVVLGFQTTVLLEAMALEKQVVYATWGGEVDGSDDELIPFAAWGDVIGVARSPDDLRAVLAHASGAEAARSRGRARAEEWLGPLDGRAAERVWGMLTRFRDERRTLSAETERARTWVSGAATRRRADVTSARIREIVWVAAAGVARLFSAVPLIRRGSRWLDVAARRARARRLEREGRRAAVELAGPFDAPLSVELADVVRLGVRRATARR